MYTPKVIIHRLDAPWLRESLHDRRRLHRRLYIAAAAAVGLGAAVLAQNAAGNRLSVQGEWPSIAQSMNRN